MTDYAGKMRALVDEYADPERGPYSSPQVAHDIVAYLRETDPSFLAGWLDEQAVHLVKEMINRRDRSQRSYAALVRKGSVFAEVAHEFAHGNPESMHSWLASVHVMADGKRKRLAEMNREELQFVAGSYESREAANRMRKIFLRELARRVGDGQVEDYFTDEELSRLWSSIS